MHRKTGRVAEMIRSIDRMELGETGKVSTTGRRGGGTTKSSRN